MYGQSKNFNRYFHYYRSFSEERQNQYFAYSVIQKVSALYFKCHRDIFIASTAITNKISLSTLNINHFERIKGLIII